MHLRPGQKILDLGCGPGIDTLALSHFVGPAGEVHGADHDAAMVAQANQRAEAAGVGARVRHRQADATDLPWPANFFDASRSERVFQHLLDPEKAFAEMVRVTRPGGWVVVLDGDWATFSIYSDEVELERRLVRFHAERMINNPYSGRALHHLFRSQAPAGHQHRGLARNPDRLRLGAKNRAARSDRAGGAGRRRDRRRRIQSLAGKSAAGCRERLLFEHQRDYGSGTQVVNAPKFV